MLMSVLDGHPGPASDIVALNAGAALYAANKAADIAHGLAMAREALSSGAARRKLDQLVAVSQRLEVA
jgi:anthranilate phosphoribosyltransferase